MKKYPFKMTSVIVFALLLSTLTFLTCSNSQNNSLAVTKETLQIPKLTFLSTMKTSPQDSIFNVCIVNSEKYLATQTVYGQLFFFDKISKTWKPVEGFGQNDWSLNSIHFFDLKNGLIAGNSGTLLRTADGGETWTTVPRFTRYNFKLMSFSNSQDGYLSGDLTIVDEKSGALSYKLEVFRTEDGGGHWNKVYSNVSETDFLFAIATVSPNVCLLAIAEKRLLRTENGGKTWQQISSVNSVRDVTFSQNKIGWLVNNNGGFFRSDDEGRSWYKPTGLPEELGSCEWWSVDIGKDGFGAAVSENGCVAYTNDGINWQKMATPIKDHLRDVVIQGQRGIILGENSVYEITF